MEQQIFYQHRLKIDFLGSTRDIVFQNAANDPAIKNLCKGSRRLDRLLRMIIPMPFAVFITIPIMIAFYIIVTCITESAIYAVRPATYGVFVTWGILAALFFIFRYNIVERLARPVIKNVLDSIGDSHIAKTLYSAYTENSMDASDVRNTLERYVCRLNFIMFALADIGDRTVKCEITNSYSGTIHLSWLDSCHGTWTKHVSDISARRIKISDSPGIKTSIVYDIFTQELILSPEMAYELKMPGELGMEDLRQIIETKSEREESL